MIAPIAWHIANNILHRCLPNTPLLHAHDRGALLSDGVFDTLCVANHQAQHADLHLQRLQNAARVLHLPCPITLAHIIGAAQQLHNGVLRLNISRGVAPRGLLPPPPPHHNAHAWLLGYANNAIARGTPIDCAAISSICRNDTSPLSGIKSFAQLDNMLALQQAQQNGACEVLLPNTRQMLACASAGNIMYTRHGSDAIFTPPCHDGALGGITRARLLPHLVVASLPISDLPHITGLAITNTLRGACGIMHLLNIGHLPESAALAQHLNKLI